MGAGERGRRGCDAFRDKNFLSVVAEVLCIYHVGLSTGLSLFWRLSEARAMLVKQRFRGPGEACQWNVVIA